MPSIPAWLAGLVVFLFVFPSSTEHLAGRHVQFIAKGTTLQALLPVEFRVVQESGDTGAQTYLTCDVYGREHEVVADGETKHEMETVLRCGGDRVYVVKQILFTESR